MTIRSRTTTRVATAVLLVTTLGLAACGGDDSSSGSSGTTAAAATTATTAAAAGSDDLCAQRDALRSSIADLKNIDIVKDGTSGLTGQLADIKQQAQDIVSDAKGDMKPEAEGFQSSVQKLEDALKGLGSGGGVTAVVTSLSAVVISATTLMKSLDQVKCN